MCSTLYSGYIQLSRVVVFTLHSGYSALYRGFFALHSGWQHPFRPVTATARGDRGSLWIFYLILLGISYLDLSSG